jgi:hypothetical protein
LFRHYLFEVELSPIIAVAAPIKLSKRLKPAALLHIDELLSFGSISACANSPPRARVLDVHFGTPDIISREEPRAMVRSRPVMSQCLFAIVYFASMPRKDAR